MGVLFLVDSWQISSGYFFLGYPLNNRDPSHVDASIATADCQQLQRYVLVEHSTLSGHLSVTKSVVEDFYRLL